jgi:hypothetical protein
MKLTSLLLIFILFSFNFVYAAQADWKQAFKEDKVTVWKKDIPGTSIVAFKGKAIIDNDIHSIFSVLFDPEHKKEFIESCTEFEVLKVLNKNESIAYSRIGSPFPLISDRDVIFKSEIKFVEKEKKIIASFTKESDRLKPAPSGVVRVTKMKGLWVLKALNDKQTQVTYEVMSDPSGLLPKWLVNLANKRMPLRTIQKLRDQSKRPLVYDKTKLLIKYMYNFNSFLSKDHPANKKSKSEATSLKTELKKVLDQKCKNGLKYACDMQKNVKFKF